MIPYWGTIWAAKNFAVFHLLLEQGEKLTVKNKKVYSGFHNWYQFYLQQLKGPTTIKDVAINTNSYTSNTEVSINVLIMHKLKLS